VRSLVQCGIFDVAGCNYILPVQYMHAVTRNVVNAICSMPGNLSGGLPHRQYGVSRIEAPLRTVCAVGSVLLVIPTTIRPSQWKQFNRRGQCPQLSICVQDGGIPPSVESASYFPMSRDRQEAFEEFVKEVNETMEE
jgi:hypothetical protein